MNLGNLGGTLYNKDIPIMKFKFKNGKLVYTDKLCYDKTKMPHLIAEFDMVDSLKPFLINRCTPEHRFGIYADLQKTPIGSYNLERILRYCHGQCIHDSFWLQQDEDTSCWKNTSIESTGIKPIANWNETTVSRKFKE